MHGEAVSMGMVQLSRVAEEKGLMPKGVDVYKRQPLKGLRFMVPSNVASSAENRQRISLRVLF